MLAWQILIDGFAISSLYALGATGFTLIFGVTGVLNLRMARSWSRRRSRPGRRPAILGSAPMPARWSASRSASSLSLATYFLIVRPSAIAHKSARRRRKSSSSPRTLLWGIMIQEAIAYLFTNNAKTVLPIVEGVVAILGVRTPANEIFTAVVCWLAIGALWLFVNRTRAGKAVLAASMNPRGVTLLGVELQRSMSRSGRSTASLAGSPACCSACFSASPPIAPGR